jgi:hypothetical protein
VKAEDEKLEEWPEYTPDPDFALEPEAHEVSHEADQEVPYEPGIYIYTHEKQMKRERGGRRGMGKEDK